MSHLETICIRVLGRVLFALVLAFLLFWPFWGFVLFLFISRVGGLRKGWGVEGPGALDLGLPFREFLFTFGFVFVF